ncbi:SRPBCC family protein [Micromonospora sp. WMMD980]|uniref:SRPBCC family protein n=1 Tax=Micromonospora sp. WMMD980 TaxID=3016088 RepID=UPI00241786D8|nr:SRPBCC family protein [Micromonospora sp. WMMD980]MDG4800219.1 SRPBCC family protein [Micromonospora sp. WMMD980]
MASIIHEFAVGADVESAWAALSDVARVNQLITFLGPVTVDGDVRTVDMGEFTIKELVVDVDPKTRRVAYSIQQSPYQLTHHHSIMQILAPESGGSGSRMMWSIDVKPDATADVMAPGVLDAIETIKKSLAG